MNKEDFKKTIYELNCLSIGNGRVLSKIHVTKDYMQRLLAMPELEIREDLAMYGYPVVVHDFLGGRDWVPEYENEARGDWTSYSLR